MGGTASCVGAMSSPVCEHGSLRRSCDLCDALAEIERMRPVVEAARARVKAWADIDPTAKSPRGVSWDEEDPLYVLHSIVGDLWGALDAAPRETCGTCGGTGRLNVGGAPGTRSDWPNDDPVCPDCRGGGDS